MNIFLPKFLLLIFLFKPANGLGEETNSKILNFNEEHAADSFIVGFKVPAFNADLDPLLVKYRHIGLVLRARFRSSSAVSLNFNLEQLRSLGMDLHDLVSEIAADHSIAYIEANTILKSELVPNDPRYPEQYAMLDSDDNTGRIGMPHAWDLVSHRRIAVVAVIDSGVNTSHPDIAANIFRNSGEMGIDPLGRDKASNGIDDDGNSYVDDWRGWDFVSGDNNPDDDATMTHGTHCAGIIAAQGNNEMGIAGIDWLAKILPLRFINTNGSGELDHAVAAIEYALMMKADILNNSWGGGAYSPTMFAAISALKNSAIFVAAAGNSGVDNDQKPHYPSSYDLDHIISVAASNQSDRLAAFSNFGAKSVDIAAPGTKILSLMGVDSYDVLSGTSMAAPHVSGAASLLKAAYPNLSPTEIKTRILASAIWLDQMRTKLTSGARLDIANALEIDVIPPSIVADKLVNHSDITTVTVSWNSSGDDADIGVASRYLLRFSTTPIGSEQAWGEATQAQGQWLNGGLGFVLEDLPHNFIGYLAIRALDNVGNISEIGNNLDIRTLEISPIYRFELTDISTVSYAEPWDIDFNEESAEYVFDDSRNGNYANDLEATIELRPNLDREISEPIYLTFVHSFDLERGYDFGVVEVSTDDGETWQDLQRYTGKKAWGFNHIQLPPGVSNLSKFRVRFRLVTDYVTVADGWRIGNIQFQTPLHLSSMRSK